jgi:hypothetical protein
MQSVFLGVPHNGTITPEAVPGLANPTERGALRINFCKGSLLAMNFNRLWCDALNVREEEKLTHWAMHHSDIEAPNNWIDTLIDDMDSVGADICSAVVPLKDWRGLTTTALGTNETSTIRRLTLTEVRRLPVVFTAADLPTAGSMLLVNTGLWICKFDAPWVEEACFTVKDAIRRKPDGTFFALSLSEDWGFSAWAHKRGLKLAASRRLRVVHYGTYGFSSEGPPGQWATDLGDEALVPQTAI